MQISTLAAAALLAVANAPVAFAKLHSAAVCVQNRSRGSTGNGTPWGLGYGSYTEYEIDSAATQCACGYYKNRNTGDKQWDKCPDCTFDGLQCISNAWHIGGDEMTYYCEKKCGAQGAEAN